MRDDDIRATANPRTDYFSCGRANPAFLARLDSVKELLTVGGRSLVQGAIGWIWARGRYNIPIPGARTAAQIEGIAGALSFGPLPGNTMSEIENSIARALDEMPDRAR